MHQRAGTRLFARGDHRVALLIDVVADDERLDREPARQLAEVLDPGVVAIGVFMDRDATAGGGVAGIEDEPAAAPRSRLQLLAPRAVGERQAGGVGQLRSGRSSGRGARHR